MAPGNWNWTIEQLKNELNQRKPIKGWIVDQEYVHRRERYFLLDDRALVADQDREVRSQNIFAKIFVHLKDKPGRQGEISKKLFTALPLGPQIDSAIEAALETDHQAWDLPSDPPKNIPHVASADPRIAEDIERVMGELTHRIETSVHKERATRFNSAELFVSIHDHELHLSNSLIHRSSQSRIYTEAAYSFARKKGSQTESDEYLNTRWAVNMDDLPIEQIFDETSDRAQHSLDVTKPKTGRYPVIVDAEVLATLFNTQLVQLSSANAYHGLPFVKPGDDLVAGATGDLISITLDPSLPHAGDTTAVSEQGLVQLPFRLVESNRVMATATDKRYADYLKTPVTTVRGNIVVEPGTLTHTDLTRHAPQVIEILQFSGLFADPNSGTFSSEIRLARLFDNEKGTVTYLKGGSLSGSFRENFKGVRFSDRQVKRAHFTSNSPQGEGYYGPEYALLSDVSIVG